MKFGLKRVICGVSGGVDSTVAAFILKQKGYDVVGAFMRNWDVVDEIGNCQADKDAAEAERVCRKLDIPFTHVNFVKEYWNEVFTNLVKDYETGFTPNPDILCNRQVKFGAFLQYARENLNADIIATGHYASNSFDHTSGPSLDRSKGARLLRSVDSFKDQTFFLSQISQEALQRTMFPVGHLTKAQVRSIAAENGFERVAQRPESMGICFIGSRNFQSFIDQYIQPRPGPFIDIETERVVGTHNGIHQWTLGQRCKIGGQLHPYFVAKKLPSTSTILVAQGTDHPALFCADMKIGATHWIHEKPSLEQTFGFRFQHTKPLVSCTLNLNEDKSGIVHLEKPLRAITPGQYAVFYSGNECLGSARILEPGLSFFESQKAESIQ